MKLQSLILASCALLSLASCRKLELEDIKNPNELMTIGAVSQSPYTQLEWEDEFDGNSYQNQDSRDCFDNDAMATCVRRLDWDVQGSCSQSIAHLKKLNKCRWAIWDGFSFWEKSNKVAAKPSQIRVENGLLKIGYQVRPDSEGPFQCGNPSNQNEFYYQDNCKVLTGGIYTRDFQNGKTPGRSFTNGRIESRARVRNLAQGAWPAIWMWKGPIGSGTPYTTYSSPNGSEYIGEIDILEIVAKSDHEFTSEALQTYHVWYPNEGPHYQTGSGTPIYAGEWNIYGVERTGDELKFYINGAYIRSIKEGDLDSRNSPTMRVDDTAKFLILSLGIDHEAALRASPMLNNVSFEVDWVRHYR